MKDSYFLTLKPSMTLLLLGLQVMVFAQFDYQHGLVRAEFLPFHPDSMVRGSYLSRDVLDSQLFVREIVSFHTPWEDPKPSKWGHNFLNLFYSEGKTDVLIRIQRGEPYAWQRISPDTSEWFISKASETRHDPDSSPIPKPIFDELGLWAPASPYLEYVAGDIVEEEIEDELARYYRYYVVNTSDTIAQRTALLQLLKKLHRLREIYVNYPESEDILIRHLLALAGELRKTERP